MESEFKCQSCGESFTLPPAVLEKYPNWTPKECIKCRDKKKPKSAPKKKCRPRPATGPRLTKAEVLQRYTGGPTEGVFTDGSASPNPGPGGWGVVWVENNQVVDENSGKDADTTNNRMEYMALIAAYSTIPEGEELTIYTDSDLCVKSMTQWAKGWEKNGWKKKSGPIKNLELVKRLWELVQARPELKLVWIKAHDGSRWNEYADALAGGMD